MIIKEHVVWAISSIVNNKLRSWLSMLGIIIWVFSIIVMLAIWQGTSSQIIDRFNSLWANLITITPGWESASSARSSWNVQWVGLMTDDFINFVKQIPWVKDISPSVSASKQLIYWTYNSNTPIIWTLPIYSQLKNLTVTSWVFITQDDITNSNLVAVLGNQVAQNAFGNTDPVWKEIRLWNNIFTVVWVLASSSQTDRRIIIPVTTAMSRITGSHYYSSLDVEINDVNQLDFMKTFVEQELDRYLNVTSVSDEPYSIQNLSEIASQIEWVTGTFTIFLAWIAAISLLVWWIWVMNIMLVSVIERTREIGIRKALWAVREDILFQFLTESLIISLLAWFIGIAWSFWVVAIINKFTTAIITSNSVLIAFWSVVFIWIVFWILPASKASKLKPIDALRFE